MPQDAPKTAQVTDFGRFGRSLGAKMEPCWHHNRININFLSANAKSLLVLEILLFFNIITFPGAKKKHQKSIKNHSKIEVKMGSPLDIDFFAFLSDFSGSGRFKTVPGLP